jgi:hypothetical protein
MSSTAVPGSVRASCAGVTGLTLFSFQRLERRIRAPPLVVSATAALRSPASPSPSFETAAGQAGSAGTPARTLKTAE